MYKEIVWLASYPKSGNTWVRLFLDAYFLGDCDINDMVSSVADDNARALEIGDGVHDIRELPIDLQQLARPMGMLRRVLAFKQNHFADVPLFMKTHSANLLTNGIELLPEMLTKATIYIVRDPRDVLPSFAKHMGCDFDTALEHMTQPYRVLQGSKESNKVSDFVSSWSKNVTSYMSTDTHNVKIFRYEDLKANPEYHFAEILTHAGIKPDPQRVKKALELTELDRLREQEKDKGFRESSPHAQNAFFGKGEIGGWKGKLSKRQQTVIEKKFKNVMKRLGYLENRKAA